MADSGAQEKVYALLVEFDQPQQLIDSIRRLREAGYRSFDAYSSFPIDQLPEAMAFQDNRVPLLALAGGILGAVLGFALQVYCNLDFPIDIGNRPLIAPQAFLLITFELTVLFAVVSCIGGMLALNGLPRLHHPIFDAPAFSLAGGDKFFLALFSVDRIFDHERTRRFLESLQPNRIETISRAEVAA